MTETCGDIKQLLMRNANLLVYPMFLIFFIFVSCIMSCGFLLIFLSCYSYVERVKIIGFAGLVIMWHIF